MWFLPGKRTTIEKRRQTMLFQKQRKRRPLEMPGTVTLTTQKIKKEKKKKEWVGVWRSNNNNNNLAVDDICFF